MKIAVIGYGSIGRRHAENASKYAEVCVYDEDISKRKDIVASGFEEVKDTEALINWEPDGVIIATPPTTHISVAQLFVSHAKAILIEKPLSNKIEGIEEFLDSAAASNTEIYVVCNMRYHPALQALKDNLPHIGKPLFARAQYGNYLPNMRPGADYRQLYCAHRAQSGGVILDAIHELDYLSWLFGEITDVTCVADKISSLDIDVEDYASLNLRHKSGVYSELHLDYIQQCKRRGCEIVGTKGTLIWQSEGKVPEDCIVRLFKTATEKWETLYRNKSLEASAPLAAMMEDYLSSLDHGKKPEDIHSGQEAYKILQTALTALSISNDIKNEQLQ